MEQQLQGAVLIIGSLYWENEENAIEKDKGLLRDTWRQQELDMEKAVKVSCPIRYGRKSGTRRNTYTMIFSNSVPVHGVAWLVPFKKTVSNENDFKAIHDQVMYLSLAEGIRKKEEHNIHKDWGMVALKIMPELEAKETELAKQLKKWWSDLHLGIINENNYRINGSEKTSITPEGFINFDFKFKDAPIQLDYVLATPVVPGIAEYPSAWQIADALKKSNPKYFTYFLENCKCRITTFQDEDFFYINLFLFVCFQVKTAV